MVLSGFVKVAWKSARIRARFRCASDGGSERCAERQNAANNAQSQNVPSNPRPCPKGARSCAGISPTVMRPDHYAGLRYPRALCLWRRPTRQCYFGTDPSWCAPPDEWSLERAWLRKPQRDHGTRKEDCEVGDYNHGRHVECTGNVRGAPCARRRRARRRRHY